MKIHAIPMQNKKKLMIFLHILFLILVISGISIMYLNSHFGKGLSWLTHETYEDTTVFTKQLKTDIDDIFSYVNYKEIFETNGKLDLKKPVISITDGPGKVKTYTLDEMVRHAKSRGLYLNEEFKITGQLNATEDTDDEVHVEWRAYEPDLQYNEPGDAYASMDTLAEEVLTHLGNYYSFYYKFVQNPSNLQFRILYCNTNTDYKLYTNTTSKTIDTFMSLGRYLYVTGDSAIVDNNINSAPKNITSLLESHNPYDNSNYYMIVAVDTSYPHADAYAIESEQYAQTRVLYIFGIISLCLGLLGCFATLYGLIRMSGFQNNNIDEINLNSFDQISTEGCILLCLIAIFFVLLLGEKIGYQLLHLFINSDNWYYAEHMLRMVIIYTFCITGSFSLLRRYKAKTLWSNSLIRKMAASTSMYINHQDFTVRLAICFILFLLFQIIMTTSIVILFLFCGDMSTRILLLFLSGIFIAVDLWVFNKLFKNALQTSKINEALFKISSGDTSYKIDTTNFCGKEKELANHINHISRGLDTALQEQVKSERLKADLITNVSHDIKTPLTSIINYVDLIKRENIKDEKIQGYLEVLEQKSQRLKTLTEDLVEASKASSGNLKLEIHDINFIELILQTNGEFQEKFSLRHLTLIPNIPDETILIEADGRHLWRVLENLYNNAYKYAMEYSRIYIDISHEDNMVIFTIKNISQHPLNIRADELTERFVRGDVARTTEGSGLGLSIAKSLTELQKGIFDIYIDGDLFKVQIKFLIKKRSD